MVWTGWPTTTPGGPTTSSSGKKPVSAPKGHSANTANRKCCHANGIPMIVIKHAAAIARWYMQIGSPNVRSHNILQPNIGHSRACRSYTIVCPKGNRMKNANLKHLIPKGIVIINKHRMIPAVAPESKVEIWKRYYRWWKTSSQRI